VEPTLKKVYDIWSLNEHELDWMIYAQMSKMFEAGGAHGLRLGKVEREKGSVLLLVSGWLKRNIECGRFVTAGLS